ncbi:MAG: Hsp70 family protein [Blautia sp.]|nr:Hsp70 family protein [Blautia sp.]
MQHYIGIDLGTTNSAICVFDGKETCIYKSPEQTDVTPSVIYIDGKEHCFYGRKAYEKASVNGRNAAMLFKRYLGTSKTFVFQDAGISLSPVECSARLLKVLYGYLPDEIRNDPETVTVITVPAAFNQMKKDATLEAARLAGIGRTALMQEPVAAVMSVLKKDDHEKCFLIYDLGGGTLDISVARMTGAHVSLLAQGGREMCGGRDMDRWIWRKVVLPWMKENFDLPEDVDENVRYAEAKRLSLLAAEEAKIALSASETASIWLDEDVLHTADESGKPMYLDLSFGREDIQEMILEMAADTADLARETMMRAGITAKEADQIVFIGGPTMYAPLREEVLRQLQIPRGTAVNPMTAVAEGASIYAESINWEDDRHGRKERFDEDLEQKEIQIRYEARTSMAAAKIAVIIPDGKLRIARLTEDSAAERDPYDSGRVSVVRQGILEVPLPETGRYSFTLRVEEEEGRPCIPPKKIQITRTLASIEAIPASHSIAVKALDRPGGVPVPFYLVEENEPLPKSGTAVFRAAQKLVGGSEDALTFSLWEGEIRDPIEDNRYIGTYRIPGRAFSGGVILPGNEIICDYEMNEAGNLRLGVSVPGVGLRMENQNFYSRFEGQVDLQNTYSLVKEVNDLLERTAQMKQRVADQEIENVRKKLQELRSTLSRTTDPETIAEAENGLMDCYKRVAHLHQRYTGVMQTHDLESVLTMFESCRENATEDEIASFRNLAESARYSIDMGSSEFDGQLLELKHRIAMFLWRQDGYVRNLFLSMIKWPGDFTDRARFDRLKAEGLTCLENRDMEQLRKVMKDLFAILKSQDNVQTEKMFDEVGIYLG